MCSSTIKQGSNGQAECMDISDEDNDYTVPATQGDVNITISNRCKRTWRVMALQRPLPPMQHIDSQGHI